MIATPQALPISPYATMQALKDAEAAAAAEYSEAANSVAAQTEVREM